MAGVKALTFDCFGTCTDWRSTISRDLANAAKAALAADTSAIPDAVRDRAARTSWSSFAQEWRGTYYLYVMSVSRDPTTPLKSIDQHNLDSLRKLLTEHDLDGLFDEDEVQRLSRRWHFLDPWPDVPAGIRALNAMGLQTCTLSNGNVELLKDMAAHADFEWTHVFSADMFGTFKPNPRVYLGAAERLGLQPHECCMVATHLADLQGAKVSSLSLLGRRLFAH